MDVPNLFVLALPDLIKKMIPPNPPGSSRPIRVDSRDNVYDALLRDDVSLITESIDRITPKGDPETKTFRGYLALPEDTPLMIGMSVEANIIIREAKNTILLPAEAIKDDTVQAVIDDRVVLRRIISGIKGTRFIEIASGISEGEAVISPFNEKLKTNARVRTIVVGTE